MRSLYGYQMDSLYQGPVIREAFPCHDVRLLRARICLPAAGMSGCLGINRQTYKCIVKTYRQYTPVERPVQCAPDILWSIFSKLLTKDTHSSPVRARYDCLSWVPNLTEVLPSNLLCGVQYRVILYCDISRVYSAVWVLAITHWKCSDAVT